MTCFPTNVDGNLDPDPPDQVNQDADSITIKFAGHFDVTQCGSGGPMIPYDDPDVVNRGGCYVDNIKVTVKSQVKGNDGSWNDIKTTSSDSGHGLHGDENHTYQRAKGATKTYRTRVQANVRYCDGSHEDFPHGGGWATSGERNFG